MPNLSVFNIILVPTLRDQIIAAEKNDEAMVHIKRRMQEGDPKVAWFLEDAEGTLLFKERLVVPKKEALKKNILHEAHISRYSIHPGSTKCIMTRGSSFGGHEWSARQLTMFLSSRVATYLATTTTPSTPHRRLLPVDARHRRTARGEHSLPGLTFWVLMEPCAGHRPVTVSAQKNLGFYRHLAGDEVAMVPLGP
jgi:hypothetical protein